MKDGQNQMLKDGALSETARKAIAGMMKLASSITAFGNTNPTSYFRLVPHQEAPTNICWGDRNRSVLVRVPLGWSAKRICACWQIRWRPQVIMILHRNRRWKCVRLTVRPICIN